MQHYTMKNDNKQSYGDKETERLQNDTDRRSRGDLYEAILRPYDKKIKTDRMTFLMKKLGVKRRRGKVMPRD